MDSLIGWGIALFVAWAVIVVLRSLLQAFGTNGHTGAGEP